MRKSKSQEDNVLSPVCLSKGLGNISTSFFSSQPETKSTAIMAQLTVIAFLIAAVASANPAASYTNHTVGDAAGWFFNVTTNTSAANYSAWAAGVTFNLGDYLIFNTNTNQTVIQTYNLTTYQICSTDDASDNDTFHYDEGSSQFGAALTVAVRLTIEGANYYFSDADDGAQCQHGMAFAIKVNHGVGLPPSLNQPPPPPYMEPPPSNPDPTQSPPMTVDQARQNGGAPRTSVNVRRALYLFLLSFGIVTYLV
ncbi:early nodulin-like protein 18 [Malania oleifera]|uniref:early nodulin-like protein 18 n=1 Tax=Malania oleifera TaxID=397392 RepID=UPI0025AEB368|nr:early nodulin-like protein 18 [Malania oleifera]